MRRFRIIILKKSLDIVSNNDTLSNMNATISISAKCSDLFSATLRTGTGVKEYDGHVPNWLPNTGEEHYGDYVILDIDVKTGKIINWKTPTQEQLNETFK